MREQFSYFTVILLALSVFKIIDLIRYRDTLNAIKAIDGVLACTWHVVLWINRKRAGENFALCLLVLMLGMNIQRIIHVYCQFKFSTQTDNIQKIIFVKRNLEFLKQKAIFSAMFCCPSMLYLGVMLSGFALSLVTISSVWLIDLNE